MTERRSSEGKDGKDSDGTTLAVVGDRALVITRVFDAPAQLVFEAITRPEHVRRWWAPRSRGEMVTCEVDLRVGGGWRYVMRTARGEVGFSGTFRAIEPPHRLVQTEIFDPFPDSVSVVTVTLAEAGGKTTLTSHVEYPSKLVRDQVLASGMEHGMRESYRQLTELVGGLVGAA
jgi:uncharacterized protein YndB with AHSA1/START domain